MKTGASKSHPSSQHVTGAPFVFKFETFAITPANIFGHSNYYTIHHTWISFSHVGILRKRPGSQIDLLGVCL